MGCCFQKEKEGVRTVYFNRDLNPQLGGNKVETTKYTWYSFLPKAIIIQFVRPANFVYLISAILQSIPEISSLNPVTAIAPFVFVIGMSLVREGYEDYRRYKKDKEINERKTCRLVNGQFVEVQWDQLRVGDIIKVKNNETIPADFVLLYSSQENQLCYVETANLDGQSNLKAKFAFVEDIKQYPNQFQNIKGSFSIDQPNSNLHQFSGFIRIEGKVEKHIDFDNIMLRETVLKNTDMAVGVIVYSGYDTKIVQNQGNIQTKISHVERKVNWIQGTLLLILILLATTCTVGYTIYHRNMNNRDQLFYLIPQVNNPRTQSLFIFFSSFLLLTFLIPISLNVSIEIIKGFLGIFLSFDNHMYHAVTEKRCSVNNVSILEELGQIDYVLTDKTGTLTANQMIFKHLSIGKNSYSTQFIINNVSTLKNDPDFHQFWLGLIICHDVVCDPDSKEYQGSSPDEVCFINFAKTIGYEFVKRTKNSLELLVHDQKIVYELLQIIAFDTRKRMSVLVRNLQTQAVYIYTKGADSCVFDKAVPYAQKQELVNSINGFAKHGFRTLLFSFRQISKLEYEQLSQQQIALKAMKAKKMAKAEQLQKKQNELIEKFESSLQILGATAIEDRLQDEVPRTIARLQAADIIVMMITGDKLQTAENIGYLANFIKEESKVFRIQANNSGEMIKQKMDLIKEFKTENATPVSLIIEGTSISAIIESEHNTEYGKILNTVSSVIFCRSSPKEKGNIVNFVKEKLGGIVLAIGDGGNDVGMIQMANVGVGIMGKEGNSASAVSDFSIGQFQFLDRLVLHHGRWFYYRLSYFFVYYGWKNLIMTLILFFFMTESAFSAFPGLSQPFIMVYNIVIGLVLVLYYSIFEQDINDDQYRPAFASLPIFYKQVKSQDLFSYRRYISWTIFGAIIAVYIYCVTRYSLGSTSIIGPQGTPGDFALFSQALAIQITIIVIVVLITDIKMYTWFSTFLVIGVLTILATIGFFLVQNFFPIGRNEYVLNATTFRFWETVFICVGSVYAGKVLIDTLKRDYRETHVEKALRMKYYQEKAAYEGIHSTSQI